MGAIPLNIKCYCDQELMMMMETADNKVDIYIFFNCFCLVDVNVYFINHSHRRRKQFLNTFLEPGLKQFAKWKLLGIFNKVILRSQVFRLKDCVLAY